MQEGAVEGSEVIWTTMQRQGISTILCGENSLNQHGELNILGVLRSAP